MTKISVDLTRANIGARVNAVQGDGNTRAVEITLLADGKSWTPPEGVEAAISYYQPSGHKGLYNLLADGSAAISMAGNVVTIILAPQMLTVSGTVQASLVFNDQQLNRLTTFPFSVSVASNPAAGAQKVEDYLRLQWLEDKLEEYLAAIKASGAFDGKPGDNGVTFTPSVSENGDLSWRNNGGLPNPQTVNIRGTQGDSTAATAAANAAKTSAENAETHAADAAASAAAAQATVGAMGTELSQIKSDIGNLDDLNTTAKKNLVAAVNEALKNGGGTVDDETIKRLVQDYLAANPPAVTETDPTVPAWAMQPQKPTYTASEVGALPDTYTPPNQTAQQVGADPAGTAATAVSQHNTDTAAHNDLRLALQGLANRVNAVLDSDDTTLDQMSEVVAYIKSNKTLIDAITTSKVSVTDIVNDLITNASDKPLSAAQGVALKTLIDAISVDSGLSETSENPVQNKVVTAAIHQLSSEKAGKDEIPEPSVVSVLDDANSPLANLPPEEIIQAAVAGKVLTAMGGVCALMNYATDMSWVTLHRQYSEINKVAEVKIEADRSYSISLHTLVADTETMPNPYSLIINGVSYDGSEQVELTIDGGAGNAVPDYVTTEAETVARIVNQHQSNDSIVFPFLCDAHCGYYTDTENKATALAGQLLTLIGKRVPFDFIVNGGDYSAGAWNTTRDNTYQDTENYTELIAEAYNGVTAVWVPGNHDDAPYMATADRATQKDVFALIGRKNRLNSAVCPNGCNYGYLDMENRKLRVIYLDTDDKRSWGTVAVGAGETAPDYLNAHNVGGEQLRWLAHTALNFTSKTSPAEWSVIVVSHVALNISGTITDAVSGTTYAHSTENASIILNAYKNGKSGSITHNDVTVAYDFSALESRAVMICCVHGHDHCFKDEMVGSILSIGCPNIMNGRERESADGNTYTKTAGTADGTSFCILTIDRENCMIYADCVGVGYDRKFAFTTETVVYTNQIPISTDTDGSVFNGIGYQSGYRLGSSGTPSAESASYITGFIPCKVGDIIRMKNVTFKYGVTSGLTSNNQRVSFYDSAKNHMVQTNATGIGGVAAGITDDDNIWIQFSPQKTMGGVDCSSVAFFRINAAYIGDDSVITINDPIE